VAGDCPEGRSCIAGFCKAASIAGIDAAPDVPPDAPCVPWDALNLSPGVTPCDAALGVPADLSLAAGAYTIDTDSGQLSGAMTALLPGALIAPSSGSLMVRVVNLGRLSIMSGATVSITGTHPLVFVVHGDATIAGTIDVSARSDIIIGLSTAGPGADDAGACTFGIGADGMASMGTGGGGGAGGGGFGDSGGFGGDGNGGGHGMHGAQGSATSNTTLVPLRGGCPGGHGGAAVGPPSGPGGRAGNGGGALEVTAQGVILVSGTLKAAGSGGGAPPYPIVLVNGGGGAGGSGGAILLDGDTVHVEAPGALCANGGGAGEGGQGGAQSDFGKDGTCSATVAASGGMINGDGGNGGNGGRIFTTAGQPGSSGFNNAGGGGGGGSVGRIRVRERKTSTTGTIDPGAIVSPAAVP